MKLKIQNLFFAYLFILSWNICNSQIIINEEFGFLQSSVGEKYGVLESTNEPDFGGLAYFFVSNENTLQSDSIIDVKFHVEGTFYEPDGFRIWPLTMNPKGQGSNISTVTVKGIEEPFKEGYSISVIVETANGHIYEKSDVLLTTPEIRIGNLIMSRDHQDLYVFMRNLCETHTYNLDQVLLNELDYVIGETSGIEIIGGDNMIPPKEIRIIKISNPFPMTVLTPVAIRINAQNTSTSQEIWASAGVRLTETHFTLGTWSSSLYNPENEHWRKQLRKLSINSSHGPLNSIYMQDAKSNYFFRTVWRVWFGDPFNPDQVVPVVQANAGKEYVEFWSIDDEPDLHSKPLPEQLIKSKTYWNNDPYTPTYVNLCVQKKYQRYGWMEDVVAMDHYAAPNAPNIIPMTWTPVIGRVGEIEEALEYTDVLKQNIEPRRMHAWSQLADQVWGQQPRDFAVNYQFWAHIMGGAKGIHWFTAKYETEEDYLEQWLEGVKLTHQFNQIKNLCLWGEPSDIVTYDNDNIISRALVGENAMVVIVLNNTISFSYSALQLRWNSSINEVNYSIEFAVPDWIPVDEIYRLGTDGKITEIGLQHLGGNSYRISPPDNLHKDSHVYIIGILDEEAPEAPEFFQIVDNPTLTDYTFSWKEPHDNFGIMGYNIYRNGELFANTRAPILEVYDGPSVCESAVWSVTAYDNSGNESESAELILEAPQAALGVTTEPSMMCPGSPITITPEGGSTGTGGNWHWYSGNCDENQGGVLLGSGNQFVFTPEYSPFTMFVKSANQCGESDCFEFQLEYAEAPIDADIFAVEETICLGDDINIFVTGGTGEPIYFGSDNDGATWNIFSGAYYGQTGFSFTPEHEGTYRIHVRNVNECGYCWDFGEGACGEFKYVDVVVQPAPSAYMTRNPTGPQCTGTEYVFYVHPSGGSGNYSYTWEVNDEIQDSDADTLHIYLYNHGDEPMINAVYVYVDDGVCTTWTAMAPTVHPQPASLSSITGETNVCYPQENLLYSVDESLSAQSYLWSVPDGVMGESETNTILLSFDEYSNSGEIRVSAVNLCGAGEESILPVSVNPTPETPYITQDGNLLISSADYGNQWYYNNDAVEGENQQEHYATEDGEYYVIVTVLGCSSEPSDPINVTVTNSMLFNNIGEIVFYPNPVTSMLTIQYDSPGNIIKFSITNALGQTIHSGEINQKVTIDMQNQSPGIYIIEFTGGDHKEYGKIIKK